ncbi:hypothetical protein JXA80_09750 [bacterium]|nr:hypothetical protein [candidate division CSSED10-310 bacterium]
MTDDVVTGGFPLTRVFLQSQLVQTAQHRVYPRVVRPEEIILCVGRAFRTLGYAAFPPIVETEEVYIPFYVFSSGNYVETIPAVGLPYRLMRTYRFIGPGVPLNMEWEPGIRVMAPDIGLTAALNSTEPAIREHPLSVTVEMVYILFYHVTIRRGRSLGDMLVNSATADVLLENAPPRYDAREARRSLWVAVCVFGGLVTTITAMWMISGSMTVAAAVTGSSILVIRSWLGRERG